jgi:hypothetical protein
MLIHVNTHTHTCQLPAQGTQKIGFAEWLTVLGELGEASGYDLFDLLCGHVRRLKALTMMQATQQVGW